MADQFQIPISPLGGSTAVQDRHEIDEIYAPSNAEGANSGDDPAPVTEIVNISSPGSPQRRKLLNLLRMEDVFNDGYDSGQYMPPTINPHKVDFHEEFVGETLLIDPNSSQHGARTDIDALAHSQELPPLNTFVPIEESDIVKMRVETLKEELGIRGLSKIGKKRNSCKD